MACFRENPAPGHPPHGELRGQCPPPSLPGIPHGAGRPEQMGHHPRPEARWQVLWVDQAVSPTAEGGLCGRFALGGGEKHGQVSRSFHGFPNSAITRPAQSLKKQPALGFPEPGLNRCHLLGTNCLESRVLFNEMCKTSSPLPRALLCAAQRREHSRTPESSLCFAIPQALRFKRVLNLANTFPLSLEGKKKKPTSKNTLHWALYFCDGNNSFS